MATILPSPPKIGMVSLGCPKNLVDSERILTKLRADGYAMSPDYAGADVVLVNTCGFLNSAKEESVDAAGETETIRASQLHCKFARAAARSIVRATAAEVMKKVVYTLA